MSAALALLFVTAAGAALRLYGIGAESLWLDEALTVSRIHRSLPLMFKDWDTGTQGPLYFLALKGWCRLFGESEAALRLPSAIFGTLTVPALFALARRWFGSATGLIAAILVAANPLAIHYSQEARPYALLLLLSTLSLVVLDRLLERIEPRDVLSYVLCTAGAIQTHPYGVFLPLAHVAVFQILRGSPRQGPRGIAALTMGRLLLFLAAAALVSFPVLFLFAREYAKVDRGTSNASWITTPDLSALGRTLSMSFFSPWLGLAALAVVAGILPWRARRDARLRRPLAASAVLWCAFALIPWLVSRLGASIFSPRYAIVGLVSILVFVAVSLAELPRGPRAALLAVLLLLGVGPLREYYSLVDKDPWRQTARFLEEAARPGDRIATVPYWTMRPLEYYLDAPEGVAVSGPRRVEDVAAWGESPGRLWLVESYSSSASAAHGVREAIDARYAIEESTVVNDRLAVNPHALHVKTIRVLRCARR